MIKKIAIAGCFASALMMVSAPANAAAYLIGGKWYYFSLDYDATLKKVTGRELKAGLQVKSDVGITRSQIQCGNPQGQILNPGQGPQLSAGGISDPVDPLIDLVKSDRSKSTFQKTVKVDLPTLPPPNACDAPANSLNGEWKPLYWQKSGCDRGDETLTGVMCYSDFAYRKADGFLYYVTGPSTGDPVGLDNEGNWTFVYLPTEFGYNSDVYVENVRTGGVTGTCTFANNPSPYAVYPGSPYSLDNPPVGGWAKVKTPYVCSETPTP